MCGIAGILTLYDDAEVSMSNLKKMAAVIHHRGPDGFGYYYDKRAGLAHARLSIIDLETGWQPIHNEDESKWIVFNGEIFNYLELREMLLSRGHHLYTKSDTEVIIHLYEDFGEECLSYLNGQFAFAIWDKENKSLFIARDRVGIRPVFYTVVKDTLLFASEIKSLFVDRRIRRELDPRGIEQIFNFWMTVSPRTAFKDVYELPAGHYMTVKNGNRKITRYWDPDFTFFDSSRTEDDYAEELKELLIDSTRLRLRADVPVGAYLSGGIDSSVITSLIKNFTETPLRTFSVTFSDNVYDESDYQRKMIDFLKTDHSDIRCDYHDIGSIFPDVIWHTEKPVLRTAPAPLFLLSGLVRESGYKVVLTGEGSDEILAGYDIFKETKIRKFMERFPDSKKRPLILKKLYPYFANSPARAIQYAEQFFKAETSDCPDIFYSHYPRWNTTSKIKLFFSDEMRRELDHYDIYSELNNSMKDRIIEYDYLSRAQYIELKTLLSGYLLSSQGDRMLMANSVEGRFPFLDHRVIEFSCKLPPGLRMNVLTEKYILKKAMSDLIPEQILKRTKQPYMAPDAKSFFQAGGLEYIRNILNRDNLINTGYFNPQAVNALVKKCQRGGILGFRDNMAIVGIVSTLLVHEQFVSKFDDISKDKINQVMEDEKDAVKV